MNLLQDFDSVYVENYEPITLLEIYYTGSFEGDMVAQSWRSIVKRNRMFLFGIKLDSTNILFNYNGNFKIKKVFAYTSEGKRYRVITKKTSDEVGKLLAVWSESDSKYTDYNRTNKFKSYKKTILRKRD